MSSDKLSLETRASSAFVQGRLEELLTIHSGCSVCGAMCNTWGNCHMPDDLRNIVNEWKQAQAELAKKSKEAK